MEPTLLVTVPLPTTLTVRVWVSMVKVAVTDLSPSIVTVFGLLVPLRAPLQPVKDQPVAGVAVSATGVPKS